jgi:hypothetical protein
MLFFPQLTTGAGAQYPLQRESITRTVFNQYGNRVTYKYADGASAQVRWRLQLQNLTDTERAALQAFFDSAEGRLKSFTFLDPTDNLLARSEDLSAPVWIKDPGISLTTGQSDPAGGVNAVEALNSGIVPGRITQSVAAPGGFHYTLSLYCKTAVVGTIAVLKGPPGATVVESHGVTPQWRRITTSGQITSSSETYEAGIELLPGQAVTLFGFQLEAQRVASEYKTTLDKTGVHPKCRFDGDEIVWRVEDVNSSATTLQLVSA